MKEQSVVRREGHSRAALRRRHTEEAVARVLGHDLVGKDGRDDNTGRDGGGRSGDKSEERELHFGRGGSGEVKIGENKSSREEEAVRLLMMMMMAIKGEDELKMRQKNNGGVRRRQCGRETKEREREKREITGKRETTRAEKHTIWVRYHFLILAAPLYSATVATLHVGDPLAVFSSVTTKIGPP